MTIIVVYLTIEIIRFDSADAVCVYANACAFTQQMVTSERKIGKTFNLGE